MALVSLFRGAVDVVWIIFELSVWVLFVNGANSLQEFLLFDLVLRCGCVAAVLLHEWSHLIAGFVLTGSHKVFTKSNILANISLDQYDNIFCTTWYGIFLLPLVGRPFTHSPHVSVPSKFVKSGSFKDGFISWCGALTSCGFAIYMYTYSWQWLEIQSLRVACTSSFAIVAVASVYSDIVLPLFCTLPVGFYGCGNWGLLVPRSFLISSGDGESGSDSDSDSNEGSVFGSSFFASKAKSTSKKASRGVFPLTCEFILRSVLDLVELRGAQAGGVATMVKSKNGDVNHMYFRAVKPKRGYLADEIFEGFRKCLPSSSYDKGFHVLAQGHSRFGTSSAPAISETHPHQWEQPEVVDFWSRSESSGKWMTEKVTWSIMITHNGDFDAWAPYGQMVPNSAMGTFLKHALHCDNTAKGDSPKFAGIMDLITTQGSWWKSLRMAFVLGTLKHVDEITNWDPSGATVVPPPSVFQEWGGSIDALMSMRLQRDEIMQLDKEINEKHYQHVVFGFKTALQVHESFNSSVLPFQVDAFVESAIKNFLYQDPYVATRMFFDNAMGTFGCSVTCTAWPSQVILAAKGQPISVGFDATGQSCVWSSEMSGLRCAKVNGKACVRYRVDLSDATGEMIELSMPGSAYLNHDEEMFRPLLGSCFAIRGERLNEPAGQGWLDGVEWAERLLDMKYEQIGLTSFPAKNVIQYDIDSIPAVIEEIDACWSDFASLNVQSGTNFARLIKQKVDHAVSSVENEERRPIDVLAIGVENSLWIVQQFVADLARLCPHLKVMALSSNWVLGALQSEAGHMEAVNFTVNRSNFNIAADTICLSVSQSGTTYPTVWASRLLRVHTPNIFALSGDFDSLLSNAIGQFPNDMDFSQRVFSTLSGVRPAEPSTVATIAMHHTLTWLLVTISSHLQGGKHHFVPPKNDMKLLARSLAPAARLLTAKDGAGNHVDSKINAEIKEMGRRWGYHLSEGYWSLVLSVLYIMVTVCIGYGVVSAVYKNVILQHIILPLTDDILDGHLYWWQAPFPYPLITFLVHFADALIYCFLGALTALGLRGFQGRRLFTRYSARSVLIVDSTMVYKLMRAYLSKLKALSWRFTTFGVAGQNAMDHFVHEYTHLTTSDVLVAAGRPDGRLASLATAESAVMMSLMQAKFIKQNKMGIEVLSIGHNPWNRPDMCRLHVVLPTLRPESCTEQMLYGKETDYALNRISPAAVVAKLEEFYHRKSSGDADVAAVVSTTIDTKENTILKRDRAIKMIFDALYSQRASLKVDIDSLPLENLLEENVIEASVSQVLAVLRGDKLKDMMDQQRFERRQRDFVCTNAKASKRAELLANLFDAWRAAISESVIQNQLAKLEESARLQIMLNLATVQNFNPESTPISSQEQATDGLTPSSPRPTNRRRSIAVNVQAVEAGIPSTATPQKQTVQKGGRMSVRCSISGVGLLGVVDLDTPPGLWRSAEARRRCLFRMNTAHQISSLGHVFQAWREAAGIESVDVRLSKKVRVQKLKRFNLRPSAMKGTVSRFSKNVKNMAMAPLRSSRQQEPAYQPRVDLRTSARMMDSVVPINDNSGHVGSGGRFHEQAIVLGYESLKRHTSSTKDLLNEVSVSELFYETRIASAERLISFMILFHEMVKPLSQVPFLGFDMDRTESRLRVASTPAPVAMHEKLPPCKWADTSVPKLSGG